MRVGFDYGNTLTDPRVREIAKSMSEQHEIYIISAVRPHNVDSTRELIINLGVPITDIIVLPFDDWLAVPQLKLEACQTLGIDLFVDDRLDTCAYLKMHGILTLYVM